MKLTKTLTFAAIVAGTLLAGNALVAQDAPKDKPPGGPGAQGGPGMRGPNAEQMAKDLGLSDEQKTKLKAAMDEQREKMKALREDTSLSADDKKAKGKELRDTFQAKVKEILTPEQFEKWQKNMQQRRPQGGPGGPGGKPEGGKPAKQD